MSDHQQNPSSQMSGSGDSEEIVETVFINSDEDAIMNVPVVTGLSSNAFLKENGLNGGPIDVPLGENEVAEFSPSAVKCHHCPKFYSNFDMLNEHILLCHPERAVGYSCAQCNAAFSNREQLEKHQLLHSSESQVSCTVCNKNFANVYRLQRHMISHDESAVLRKFKCPQCEKAFKFKHHLKEHIRIHSGEKPFVCEHCGKRFSHSGSYSSHNTSKKCLIMNLKVNHRNRNAAAEAKAIANGNLTGGRVPANKSKTLGNNNNTTSINNNNNNKTTNNNSDQLNNRNNHSPNNNNNNNNLLFTPILPKYPDGTSILLPTYSPSVVPPSIPFYSISPYRFGPNFQQLLAAAYLSNSKEAVAEEMSKSGASAFTEDSSDEAINREVKMEEDELECEKLSSASSSASMTLPAAAVATVRPPSIDECRTSSDLEPLSHFLQCVNESVTKQQQSPLGNMQVKLSSASGSSGCPSIKSEVPSSPAVADEQSSQSQDSSIVVPCSYCGCVCHSLDELRRHEKFECSAQEDLKDKEGLALKLKDVISGPDMNGTSAFNSDSDDDVQSSGKDFTMTEDEDFVDVSDGRKVRVRSQIAEDQLAVLKQHYALNPRPKREELEIISQRVNFPVRVVQVWFQNNRARHRREGRLIPIPYSPSGNGASIAELYQSPLSPRLSAPAIAAAASMDQPLDLSTKRSANSSPASSLYPYDSDDCGAVNLSSRQSPPSVPLHHQMVAASTTSCGLPTTPLATSVSSQTVTLLEGSAPTTPVTSPLALEKRMLPYQHRGTSTPNSGNSIFFAMDRIGYTCNASHSSVASGSPIYNGSCSPNSSDSWKLEYLHSNETMELMKDESKMGDDMSDSRSLVTSTKKPKMMSNNVVDSEMKNERPHKCELCPKAFKHKHHLTEHKRLHSGEKPFQCSQCFKRFSHSGSYSQHKNHRFSYCKPYRD